MKDFLEANGIGRRGGESEAREMNAFPENSTIVLVHGAWADGSCWTNVILPLQRRGLKVTCIPIPLTSLSDDVAALNRAVERTSGPLVLAAHAYGGAVIAGVRGDRVKSLVYIAALAPDEGETVAKVFYRDEPDPKAPKLHPMRMALSGCRKAGFSDAVAHKASADQTSIMQAVQRPLAVQCIQQPAPAPTWKEKPSWFLLAEEDRMINPKSTAFRGRSHEGNCPIRARRPFSDVHGGGSRDRPDPGSCGRNPLDRSLSLAKEKDPEGAALWRSNLLSLFLATSTTAEKSRARRSAVAR